MRPAASSWGETAPSPPFRFSFIISQCEETIIEFCQHHVVLWADVSEHEVECVYTQTVCTYTPDVTYFDPSVLLKPGFRNQGKLPFRFLLPSSLCNCLLSATCNYLPSRRLRSPPRTRRPRFLQQQCCRFAQTEVAKEENCWYWSFSLSVIKMIKESQALKLHWQHFQFCMKATQEQGGFRCNKQRAVLPPSLLCKSKNYTSSWKCLGPVVKGSVRGWWYSRAQHLESLRGTNELWWKTNVTPPPPQTPPLLQALQQDRAVFILAAMNYWLLPDHEYQ